MLAVQLFPALLKCFPEVGRRKQRNFLPCKENDIYSWNLILVKSKTVPNLALKAVPVDSSANFLFSDYQSQPWMAKVVATC
jgi:hypothetical protein